MITHIETEEEFYEALKKENVIVDFYAPWCSPCRMMGSILEDLDGEENLNIIKVNVDDLPSIASAYQVASIPMILLVKNGEIVATQIGFLPKASLARAIDKYLI